SGIGVARAAVLVSTTVWPTPGSVSSCRSAAAAAANAGTPGTTCHGTPAASSRRACSATALKIDGSPLCSRTTSCPASCAETSSAVIASRSRSAVFTSRAPGLVPPRTSGGTRLPAYSTTGASPSSRWARTVSRSGAPGPAPTNHTVMGNSEDGGGSGSGDASRLDDLPLRDRQRGPPGGEPAQRRLIADGQLHHLPSYGALPLLQHRLGLHRDRVRDEPAAAPQRRPARLDHAFGRDAAADEHRVGLGQASQRAGSHSPDHLQVRHTKPGRVTFQTVGTVRARLDGHGATTVIGAHPLDADAAAA